jgi:hypothetical protein
VAAAKAAQKAAAEKPARGAAKNGE